MNEVLNAIAVKLEARAVVIEKRSTAWDTVDLAKAETLREIAQLIREVLQ